MTAPRITRLTFAALLLLALLALAPAPWSLAPGAHATPLTASRDVAYQVGEYHAYKVADNVHIYRGALVCVDNTTGYANPAASTVNYRFVGVADQECDNTLAGHVAGGKSVRVRLHGDIKVVTAGAAITDTGRPVFVEDDQTVNCYDPDGIYAGTVSEWISATSIRINYNTVNTSVPVVVTLPITLSKLANGDIVTNWTPGFSGLIESIDFIVHDPATTAAKLSSLNLEIGTTNVTGGVVALTSDNCTPMGAKVAGTAITALNFFDADDTISLEAASTTAFVEGTGYLLIVVRSFSKP